LGLHRLICEFADTLLDVHGHLIAASVTEDKFVWFGTEEEDLIGCTSFMRANQTDIPGADMLLDAIDFELSLNECLDQLMEVGVLEELTADGESVIGLTEGSRAMSIDEIRTMLDAQPESEDTDTRYG
jgi:hypothetical protein